MEIVEFLTARADDVASHAGTVRELLTWLEIDSGEGDRAEALIKYLGAEATAIRGILREHPDHYPDCRTCDGQEWPCATVLALAQPFAENPDFDPAWKVSE